MHSVAQLAGLSLFYSGPSGYARLALARAKTFSPQKKLLKDFWLDPKYPDAWQNDEMASKTFFDRASAAMALRSSGDVYVLLPSDTMGTNWFKGTVWDREEWPNLAGGRNPMVNNVYRINPDNSNQERIYHKA